MQKAIKVNLALIIIFILTVLVLFINNYSKSLSRYLISLLNHQIIKSSLKMI